MAVKSLTVQALRDWLARGESAVLLDVREPWETAICALPGARHIPMGDVPAAIAALPKDGRLVVICHHGVRSLHVAHYLHELGRGEIYNLAGGIDAWAREIDPTVPTY